MDDYFKTLRKIQKRERSNGSLARVDDKFYKNVYTYIRDLKEDIGLDPFSEKQEILKEVQRIATEICERREHKITEAALMNIHRSYHLFKKDKPQFDILDTTPLNLTKEEEKLYFSIIDTLKGHRNDISLDKFSHEVDEDEEEDTTNDDGDVETEEEESRVPVKDEPAVEKDEVLNHLDKIKNARVVTNTDFEPIEKQVQKSKNDALIGMYENPDDQFVNLDDVKPKTANADFDNVTILVFKDVGSIVGVDEKVYGPFHPQDVVVLPKINADVLLKYRKARLVKI